MTKRRRTRQCNHQKKKASFGHCIVLSFFWSFYCLVLLVLVILLTCPSSFGDCIVLSFFFWSLHCLVLLLFVILLSCPSSGRQCNDQKKKDKTIEWPKEEGQDNRMNKRRTRQCNDQKKKDKTMQWLLLSCPSCFGHSIDLSFFFWWLHCLVLLVLVIALSCPSSFGHSIVLSLLQWPN
jgi:hypothetical protein